ncbi:MAG: TIR domain-containing protein [Lachnospiraceae bacterium]|nr:TIR domain-containing protein [Lachnospiraceae bacterium]
MLDRTPVVFISYSWTDKEYQQSIIDLASRMRHDGVDVKLDVWDLKEGQDKYKYMEQCVTDPQIDKVLILSNKLYAEKADKREGGVGDETTIISPEVYGNAEQQKFIPIVMERDENGKECLPAYLKTLKYRDLSGDNFEEEYEAVLRIIFDEPIHRKPELGSKPDWLTEETPDNLYPVKNAVKKITVAELGRMKVLAVRDFVDIYIEAMKQFYVKNIDAQTYLTNFGAIKQYRDVFLDHLKAFSSIEHFGSTMADEFERIYNTLYDVHTFDPESFSCGYNEFDLFRIHIWELFICTVTYMLHYEMYADIHDLLVHTYFLRTSPLGNEKRPFSYEMLRFHSKMIEEEIKHSLPDELARKYTLTGHYIVNDHEYLPIYSGKAMANADLFLYQAYNALELDELTEYGPWFPTLYIYADEYDSMWKRLASKKFCEKIMPVFGVKSIDDLKKRISKCVYDKDYHYRGAWLGAASAIQTWIKIEQIATLI